MKKSPYTPSVKQEGVNWWTLGSETGSQDITFSEDVGLWMNDYFDGKDHYTYSVISGYKWTTNGSNEFLYYDDASYEFPLTATITFTPYKESSGDSGTVSGQPLPTPVVTLLIALALGAGFVMYRKQRAEA